MPNRSTPSTDTPTLDETHDPIIANVRGVPTIATVYGTQPSIELPTFAQMATEFEASGSIFPQHIQNTYDRIMANNAYDLTMSDGITQSQASDVLTGAYINTGINQSTMTRDEAPTRYKRDIDFNWSENILMYNYQLNNKLYACSSRIQEKYFTGKLTHEELINRSVFVKRSLKVSIE